MATNAVAVPRVTPLPALRFGAVTGAFLAMAALTAAVAPVWLSIWSVFLFAGPHNWMEARYLLARMPVRWGAARHFFFVALAGVPVLSVGWLFLETRGAWHTALFGWIWLLAYLHDRKLAARWRAWLVLAAAVASITPTAADYAVVYAHPLLALWFLDRQLQRSKPEWRPAWRLCLAAIPVLAALVAWFNRLPSSGTLELTLVAQAGHPAFVAVHAFLELSHYAVWIVGLPLLGLAQAPWALQTIPLVRHRFGWPRLVKSLFLVGAALCLLLWLGFAVDYETTRSVYFMVAIVHVIAEAPFLIRLSGR